MIELPWRLVDEGDPAKADILDAGGILIADSVWLEQANQIVKAVNAYPKLIAACEAHQAVGDHVQTCSRCGDGRNCNVFNGLAYKADELTRAALEAANVEL